MDDAMLSTEGYQRLSYFRGRIRCSWNVGRVWRSSFDCSSTARFIKHLLYQFHTPFLRISRIKGREIVNLPSPKPTRREVYAQGR